jgi:tetratricopeptide (TPR) repeat protein
MIRSPLIAKLRRLSPIRFLRGWLESRRWRFLLSGLPAMVACAGGLALHLEARRASTSDRVHHYVTRADGILSKAVGANTNPGERRDDSAALLKADLYYRRAVILDPNNSSARLGIAKLTAARGDVVQARRIMERLAVRPDESGLLANEWLIRDALARIQTKQLTEPEFRELPARLEKIVARYPSNVQARELLGSLYFQRGALDAAKPHLEAAVESKPELYLVLAEIAQRQQQRDLALDFIQRAEKAFAAKVLANPSDNLLRRKYASVLTRLKKFEAAKASLIEGLRIEKSTELTQDLATLYAIWAGQQLKSADAVPTPFELVSDALAIDPKNAAALMVLVELTNSSTADGARAVAILEEKLASGQETHWIVHLMLGTLKAQSGDAEQARMHLEQAQRMNAGAPAILNNLAWLYAHQSKPNFERALELANSAVKLQPDSPQLRETRGQILVGLEKWADGLEDLEFALPAYARQEALRGELPLLHMAIATAYEKLGNASMAERHRQLAKSTGPAPGETPAGK